MNFIQNDSNNLSVTQTAKKIFGSSEPSSVFLSDEMDDSSDLNMYTSSEIEKKCKKITSYFMKYSKSPTGMTSNTKSIGKKSDSVHIVPAYTSNEGCDLHEIKSLLNYLIQKTTEIVLDEKLKGRLKDINVKKKIKKPHIPVQLVSPRKPLIPLKHKIACHSDEISPPCNSTRLGLEAKEWLRNHPSYITRNLEKELHSNKPIHRKIMAMEKVKTPTKSNPSTPSKLYKTKPLLHSLETIKDASPLSPAQISLNERLKLLENVPATPLRARWLKMLNEIPQASKISCNSQFNDLMSEISTNKSTLAEEPNSSTSTKINDNEESELLPTPSVSNEIDNNEPEELSLPTATNFINKIIHNEIIHGNKPTESQNWANEDILVLDTQPDDYDVLNDTTNAEQEIPESQLNNTSILQEQEII